jgi:hypothetical protein
MKLFLEILETKEEDSHSPVMEIRVEKATREECIALLPTLEPLFAGKNYKKQIHTCYNDEAVPKSCEIEVL